MTVYTWLQSKTGREREELEHLGLRVPDVPIRYMTPEEDKLYRSREGRNLSLFEPKIDSFSFLVARLPFNQPQRRKEQEMHKPRREEAVEFIENYFNHNPKASTSDCARVASAARIQVNMDLISNIKLRMRQAQSTPQPVQKPVEKQNPAPQVFNSPRVVGPPLKIVPGDGPGTSFAPSKEMWDSIKAEIAEEKKEPVKLEGEELKKAKIAYLNEILDKDPGISVRKIQDMLKEKHGGSLNPMYILDTMKVAKELAGIVVTRGGNNKKKEEVKKEPSKVTTKPPSMPPFQPPVDPGPRRSGFTRQVFVDPRIENKPPPSNQRMLTWTDANGFHFEVAKLEEVQKKVLVLMGKGIDTKTIQVWKLTNFKVSIDIE